MAFPEFDPDRTKILFFSRGRGRGHAIPDIEIAKELMKLRVQTQIRFVSYGIGARTLEEFGQPLIDIGLPEANGTAETTVLAGKLIGWLQPDFVVAHEEFAALPAAKIFDTPAVFITDWFTDPNTFSMHSLHFADIILFTGERGQFSEPKSARGKVKYVGPAVRAFQYSRKDRVRARHELGLPREATIISVFPGSWTETLAPIFDVVIGAFDKLRASPKHLLWLGGDDHVAIARKVRRRTDVTVIEKDWIVDRLMAATDLAITKGSRNVSTELAVLGIRSLAISYGLNKMDDHRTRALSATQLTPHRLSSLIAAGLQEPPPKPRNARGTTKAARAIFDHIAERTRRT